MPAAGDRVGFAENPVFAPDHQMRRTGEYLVSAAGAQILLAGLGGADLPDHPFAVARALHPGCAGEDPVDVELLGLRLRAPPGTGALPGSAVGPGTIGAGHLPILPQQRQVPAPGAVPGSGQGRVLDVRLVIARCSVDYEGRLKAHLPLATRLLLVKADGSVLVHSDGGSYKPLNWMSPPATLRVLDQDLDDGLVEQWVVQSSKTDDRLIVSLHEKLHESSHELGTDPGLIKDGVEADLQRLLAAQIETLGEGYSLIRREYFTAIGPVDILARDAQGGTVAIELKRRGDIDGVEQLTRYLELLNRDPLLAPVRGIFAAQQIKPQARVLANDRVIDCVTLDYDALRGVDDSASRLF